MSKYDKFWLNDYSILYNSNKVTEFFPTTYMNLAEKLNSIVRLSIYLGIILLLIKNNYLYIYIPLITSAISVFIYNTYSKNEGYEQNKLNKYNQKKKKNKSVKPTIDNPFMNINLITDDRKRESATLSFDKPKIQEEIEDKFSYNLYRDVSDLYGKSNSQREFYTTPSTTIPNDQTSFAKWCYNTGSTCKEDTIKCAPFTASNMYSQQLDGNNFTTLGSSLG